MRSEADERRSREACIRSTFENDPRHRGLRSNEIDMAVDTGMKISDETKGLNWGQIADAAAAVVKNRP